MSLRGRLLFTGQLTDETVDRVAEHMNTVLRGKRYTMVTQVADRCPEVRVGMRLRPRNGHVGVDVDRKHDTPSIHLDDMDYLISLYVGLSRPTHVTITTEGVEVEHYAPGGNHLWWVWAVEGELEDT